MYPTPIEPQHYHDWWIRRSFYDLHCYIHFQWLDQEGRQAYLRNANLSTNMAKRMMGATNTGPTWLEEREGDPK